MAEPLKNMFGPDVALHIGRTIEAVYPGFDTAGFVADALEGYDDLELTPRARQIARCLAAYLPADFEEAAPILLASLGPPIDGDEVIGQGMVAFAYLPHVFYVAECGVGHWETAMEVQYELTQRFSCEFSIRTFLEGEPQRTLARLGDWVTDPNPHVRRLVSEGTRPRLPWAPRLRGFVDDPAPVVSLLERLKDDPAAMVRRSVANNLNDIGKDHPDVLVDVCRRWMVGAGPERTALVRHALRSAVKRGEPGAFAVLGLGSGEDAHIDDVSFDPETPVIGGQVRVTFTVTNGGTDTATYEVDLKVHFVRASGAAGPKVFKVRRVDLEPGGSVDLAKTISLAQQTTRTHYPGEHHVEIVVNGSVRPAGSFLVR